MNDIPVPLPPLEAQQAIVTEIEFHLSDCDKIKETTNNAIKQVSRRYSSYLMLRW